MKASTTFPPGAGWIPVAVVMIIVALVSALTLTPQFNTQFVGGGGAASKARPVLKAGIVPGSKPGTKQVTTTKIINGKAVQVTEDVPLTPQDVTTGGDAGTTALAGSADQTITDQGTAAGGGGSDPGSGDPGSGSSGGSGGGGGGACSGFNDGRTPGVSDSEIHLASTIVTDGVGSGFLGEAQNGIQAALDQANRAGGICGRRLTIEYNNSSWDRQHGAQYIDSYIGNGKVFALVGEPDSEGLAGASDSGAIDRAGIPVVGTDGMLKDQYHDPWIWPVSASTVTNAHIVADYAANVDHAQTFGVVYDTHYKFGAEGADAFVAEVHRVCPGCKTVSRGIDGTQTGGYSTDIAAFNNGCGPCDAVLMLLEPAPAQQWMRLEGGHWYNHLYGGEPLFNAQFARACGAPCGDARIRVWTGYKRGVAEYVNALKAKCTSCDPENEFTEGAYLGTRMFIEAAKRIGAQGIPLTRDAIKHELDTDSFDLGLTSSPLVYAGQPLHGLANTAMSMFAENYAGTFNGWNDQSTGYRPDPAPGSEQ